MNRTKLLAAVLDVVEVLDKHLEVEEPLLRVGPTVAERVMELLWARKDENAVECAERWAKMINRAGELMEQREDEGFLDAVERIVNAATDQSHGDSTQLVFKPEDWEAIRKALCARGDSETTLAAAERNRDRIIELAREIDEYDRQVAKAMRPIEVAPGKAVDAIHKLWTEVHTLRAQLAEKTKELDEAKGRTP